MRLLLDHNVDRHLAAALTTHAVATARGRRWEHLSDALLLQRAQAEFDVLVTCDRSLAKQNHIPGFDVAVVVLAARTHRFGDLLALVPRLLAALEMVRPGEVVTVGPDAD